MTRGLRRTLPLAAACTLALAGCATVVKTPTEVARFDLEGECVAGWSALPVQPVVLVGDKKPKLNPRSYAELARCVEHADGRRAPAALFTLDGAQAPYQVEVQLFGGPHGALAAAVVLLDGEFQPLRRVGYERFVHRHMNRTLTLFVNPDEAAPRYVLVVPDAVHVGQSERVVAGQRWTTPIVTPTVIGSYSDGVESRVEVPLTDVGALQIAVRPHVLPQVGM